MSFTVVYLSETGVGQTIGERIHREASSHGMTCNLFSAADFAKVDWKETKVFVFIASSTGQISIFVFCLVCFLFGLFFCFFIFIFV